MLPTWLILKETHEYVAPQVLLDLYDHVGYSQPVYCYIIVLYLYGDQSATLKHNSIFGRAHFRYRHHFFQPYISWNCLNFIHYLFSFFGLRVRDFCFPRLFPSQCGFLVLPGVFSKKRLVQTPNMETGPCRSFARCSHHRIEIMCSFSNAVRTVTSTAELSSTTNVIIYWDFLIVTVNHTISFKGSCCPLTSLRTLKFPWVSMNVYQTNGSAFIWMIFYRSPISKAKWKPFWTVFSTKWAI